MVCLRRIPAETMRRKAFTLIEVLVVVAIIALLVAILLPSLSRARELGKRAVCVSDLHMLGVAWTFYHTDNKSWLVYAGTTGTPAPSNANDWYKRCPPGWLRSIPGYPYNPTEAPEALQLKSIRDAALYRYARTTEIYRCPSIPKGEFRTFGIPQGASCTAQGNPAVPVSDNDFPGKLSLIKLPGNRIVFIDAEPEDWDAVWWIHYDRAAWWNQIVPRHGAGQTLCFADGHAAWWPWLSAETFKYMSHTWDWCEANINSNDQRNNPDCRRIQIATWGRLTY
jgi:prepilin-type N-terminal cleavage/methylation domain-containing protein